MTKTMIYFPPEGDSSILLTVGNEYNVEITIENEIITDASVLLKSSDPQVNVQMKIVVCFEHFISIEDYRTNTIKSIIND